MPYFDFDNKKVWFDVKGQGKPLLLLHGNAASSAMFGGLVKMYSREYKVILLDFPGNGKSERMPRFETDSWFYNSRSAVALLDELGLEQVAVIGSSGGAISAIDLALEHPERVSFLIADSFEGEYPLASYVNILEQDREQSKSGLTGRLFYYFNHGRRWKKVVDADTRALADFYRMGKSFFRKPISDLAVPTLLVGSREDEFCDCIEDIYKGLKEKNGSLKIHMFERGKHPAMISNSKAFFDLVKEYI